MKNANARFEFYLVQLEQSLQQASKEDNPGLWLYNNKARTTLFMLESLAKLYAAIHNKNSLTRIKDHFKLLEDTLGDIDYYDCFAKEFDQDPNFPATIKEFLHAQSGKQVNLLNNILVENKWIGKKQERIKKIRNKLADMDWMKPKEEIKAIEKFYKESIGEIKEFFESTGGSFTDLEKQVHTIRRKLRWLSIYAQSLQGAIQLTDNSAEDDATIKYLTPEIVDSPFNKMPDASNNTHFLLLEKKYFLSLSWIIDALGVLKDNGHRIVAVTEAIQQTEGINQTVALHKALQLLGSDEIMMQKINDNATDISKQFFTENNLDKMIHGTSLIEN